MSYQEKKTVVSLVTGAFITLAYCLSVFTPRPASTLASGDLKAWAVTMLVFIGIGIVASIVIQIIFHILLSVSIAVKKKIQDESVGEKESEKSICVEMVEDEMDHLIELKSTRFGPILSGIGFVAALFSLVLGYSPVVMLNIIFLSFCGGSLLEGLAQIYYYRKGLAHV